MPQNCTIEPSYFRFAVLRPHWVNQSSRGWATHFYSCTPDTTAYKRAHNFNTPAVHPVSQSSSQGSHRPSWWSCTLLYLQPHTRQQASGKKTSTQLKRNGKHICTQRRHTNYVVQVSKYAQQNALTQIHHKFFSFLQPMLERHNTFT